MKKINVSILFVALFVPLVIGVASAMLSADGMEIYTTMAKPPLSPPGWVFSVAWTILYLLMGLCSYLVVMSVGEMEDKRFALCLYVIQLVMNFWWSIIFFNGRMYLFAFIWLVIMWCIVIVCTMKYYGISKLAAYLMIPYILWLTFAAYLNMGAYVLSKAL